MFVVREQKCGFRPKKNTQTWPVRAQVSVSVTIYQNNFFFFFFLSVSLVLKDDKTGGSGRSRFGEYHGIQYTIILKIYMCVCGCMGTGKEGRETAGESQSHNDSDGVS